MTRVGWDGEAWAQVRGYEEYWTPFDDRFHFRPGMDPATWPAITEPEGSVTFDLAPIFASGDPGFESGERRLNRETLEAFPEAFPNGTRLVALDWQHPAYWFWPHRHLANPEPWRLPPFPNGDYFIFLTEELSQGTFGHPWEQTFCVFGDDLVRALVPRLTEWLPVKRSTPA